MGCDGTLLKHQYNIVKNKTLRGKNLKDYPLPLLKYRIKMRELHQKTQIKKTAKITSFKVYKDLKITPNLQSKYNIDLDKLLNVRSSIMLIELTSNPKKLDRNMALQFHPYSYRGRLIPNEELEQNSQNTFINGSSICASANFIDGILELHCLPHNLIQIQLR